LRFDLILTLFIVIPAKAGIQAIQQGVRIALDPGLRRGDVVKLSEIN